VDWGWEHQDKLDKPVFTIQAVTSSVFCAMRCARRSCGWAGYRRPAIGLSLLLTMLVDHADAAAGETDRGHHRPDRAGTVGGEEPERNAVQGIPRRRKQG